MVHLGRNLRLAVLTWQHVLCFGVCFTLLHLAGFGPVPKGPNAHKSRCSFDSWDTWDGFGSKILFAFGIEGLSAMNRSAQGGPW